MNTASDNAIHRLADEALQRAAARHRVPTATYRLQMHAGFNLQDARRVVPYLHRLGISHLYLSSLLKARTGSRHGYDVAEHRQLNPELGSEADLAALFDELARRNMGVILDVVPNHMWVGGDNPWWMDVLENGAASPFANYFDIAWDNHPREKLRGKVLLPILDEPYGRAIEAGRFRLYFENGSFGLSIDQTRLPLDPRTYATILAPALESVRAEHPAELPAVLELQSILTAVRHLPSRDDSDVEHMSEGLAESAIIKRRLRELAEIEPEIIHHINSSIDKLNGSVHDSPSFSGLTELLDAQVYRPCFWRVALDEINYRRFFDVNDLAALAAEREDVFLAIHTKAFEWLRHPAVAGLRIDHVDGLLDPREYLDRLQFHFALVCARERYESDPEKHNGLDWTEVESHLYQRWKTHESPPRGLYVVVEKILGPGERLPQSWVCDGTTGYEFLNEVNDLFVDTTQAQILTEVYRQFTGLDDSFEQVAYENKLQILRTLLASELHVLTYRLDRLAQEAWWSRDFTFNGLRHALEEIIACFPVYRTYIAGDASPSDRVIIQTAARRARAASPLLGREIFDFIVNTLLLRDPPTGPASEEYRAAQREFAGKFQQLTAPVMAKGVEDTSYYVFNRLASLNEVGGDPSRFGDLPSQVHRFFTTQAAHQPGSLAPLSTHDTKRGEDVRARLNLLSEMPAEWGRRIATWRDLNRAHKTELEDGVIAPDDNEEYLLYQILLGAWPADSTGAASFPELVKRIQDYMTKATREAKVHSSWIKPDVAYDEAVSNFVATILDRQRAADFLADFLEFQADIHRLGVLNSLSQTLIHCTAPGVPDIYQGTELWDTNLVDPDNRRDVNYAVRADALENLDAIIADRASLPAGQRKPLDPQRLKLLILSQSLRLRRNDTELFQKGAYIPLESTGPHAAHLFGFLRTQGRRAVLIGIPRLVGTLERNGCLTGSPPQVRIDALLQLPREFKNATWQNVLSGADRFTSSETVPAHVLFADFPVALWLKQD